MKIREGFVLRDVAGKTFVVATGALSEEFSGMITLNETGKFIWNCIAEGLEGEQIVEKILATFEDADKEIVTKDVETFINKLIEGKIVE
ncbi:MAG: PqqD family protein [Clostridia bacterium]|nr:PqqD family protein [Clostridia bacterium]